MKKRLKTQLSLVILVIILITISLISFLSNYFINKQFTAYITRQQEIKTQIIRSSISGQYMASTKQWNNDYVHAIGMYSLYEGYIIKVYDENHQVLWDAQSHDMNLCHKIMKDISSRMSIQYPQMKGSFKSSEYKLEQNGTIIGSVSISYFGPFFLNENDFKFLHSLNIILISVGIFSLLVSILVGHILAKRISKPILKTIDITREIAAGNYNVRLEENNNTQELDMLVQSINQLAMSLETMERLRKQMTQDVAHELRTPITILQSYLEAMADGMWEASPDRLQSCYEEVQRIGSLIGDLEKLTKIESENLKLNIQELDLYEIIDKTVSSFEKEIIDKEIDVNIIGPHLSIFADLDRMKQVVVNLLSNAIKYSSNGCEITFELLETKDHIGFYIKDNGYGIPKEDLPYIFERFYRADKSRNHMTGGSGIGLTIVKSIVNTHGGTISVESSPGEGSKFTIMLPKPSKS